jgi:hypothetical protein
MPRRSVEFSSVTAEEGVAAATVDDVGQLGQLEDCDVDLVLAVCSRVVGHDNPLGGQGDADPVGPESCGATSFVPNCTLEHAAFELAVWCPDCGTDTFADRTRRHQRDQAHRQHT